MPIFLPDRDSPMARRFSQVCVISLAALLSSGTGLLAYLNDDPGPAWLRSVVLAAAVMVAVSFGGWLLASLGVLSRNASRSRRS